MPISDEDFQVMLENVQDESLSLPEIMEVFSNVRESVLDQFEEVKAEIVELWKVHGSPDKSLKLGELKDMCMQQDRNVIDATSTVALAWLFLYADPVVRLSNVQLIMQHFKCTAQIHLIDSLADSIVIGLNEDLVPSIPDNEYIQ